MRSWIRALFLTLSIIAMWAKISVASPAGDIRWISTLPGVTLGTSVERGGRCENVYTVMGSTAEVMEAIRVRLVRDGWTVGQLPAITRTDSSLRGIDARKGPRRIQVAAHEVGGVGGLAVDYSSHGSASTGASSTMEGDVAEAPTPPATSGDVVLDDGHIRQTYAMNGGNVVVNSSHNAIVITGRVQSVVINGSNNHVSVQAAVGQINCNGSWNTIQWSRSKNPKSPQTTNWGMDNKLSPID